MGGWGNLISLLIIIIVLLYTFIRNQVKNNNSCYVKGVSNGISEGVKGNIRLYYKFYIDGEEYTGAMPANFCDKCDDCCKVGNIVIVRFEKNNPTNNDLITEIPSGLTLENDQTYCSP